MITPNLTLYVTRRSPYARKVWVAIIEKGFQDQLTVVVEDLQKKSRDLLEANPIAKVPTLATDTGLVLYDSISALEFVELLSPSPQLFPTDSYHRLAVINDMSLANGLMDVTVSYVLETFRPKTHQLQAQLDKNLATIDRILTYLESRASELSFEVRADVIALASAISYLNFRIPEIDLETRFPELDRWYRDIEQWDSFIKTIPVA